MNEAYCEVSHQLIHDLEDVYPGLLNYTFVEDKNRLFGTILIKDATIPDSLNGKFVKFSITRKDGGTEITWTEAENIDIYRTLPV